MGLNKKTARLVSGGKNFIFQGLSTAGSVLGIGCGFSDVDFFSVFQGLDSVLFVGFLDYSLVFKGLGS
jgi:flagellar biosynthesis protein FliR